LQFLILKISAVKLSNFFDLKSLGLDLDPNLDLLVRKSGSGSEARFKEFTWIRNNVFNFRTYIDS
jgi:hypothetical protein